MSYNELSEMNIDYQRDDRRLGKSSHFPMPLFKDTGGSYSISYEDDADDSLDLKLPSVHHHKLSEKTRSEKREKHSRRNLRQQTDASTIKSKTQRKDHCTSQDPRDHNERIRIKHHHREHYERDKFMIKHGERVKEDVDKHFLQKRHSKNKCRMKMEYSEEDHKDVHKESLQIFPLNSRESLRKEAERHMKKQRKRRLLEAEYEVTLQKDVCKHKLKTQMEHSHVEKEIEQSLHEMAKKGRHSHSRERKKNYDKSVESSRCVETEGVFFRGFSDKLSQQSVTESDNSEEDKTGSGVENCKAFQLNSEDYMQEVNEDETSSVDEEEEGGGSSSATEKEFDDNEKSANKYAESEERYNNYRSSTAAGQCSSSVVSEVDQHKDDNDDDEDSKTVSVEGTGNKMEENEIGPGNDESPKFDVVLYDSLPPYLPAIQGCRSEEEFQQLNRIEEGAFGIVYRARDKRTNEIVALKRLKMEKEKEGFPITSLREINTLLKAQHPNIVTVREIVVGSNMDKIFIVMDYVEHDLKSLMEIMKKKKESFSIGEVKCLLLQLLRAVAHLHDNWILHRDLKTSNLLLSHKGILKVGDFGLAREYGSPLRGYTPIVVTLWYRAPELLLCTKEYSTPVDMWSVGCIFGEFLLMEALFPGKSEVEQLNRIFKDLGTPNERIWPGFKKLPAVQKVSFRQYRENQLRERFGSMLTVEGMDLMNRFLTYDPVQRVTAKDALRHAYFTEAPLPIDPSMFPVWPAKSELGYRKAAAASPKPPPGGQEYKQMEDEEEAVAEGFHISNTENGLISASGGFCLKF